MKKKLIKMYRTLRSWYRTVLCAKTDYKLNFYTRFLFALRGFNVNEYFWYNLKENSYKDYISDFSRVNSRDINGDYKFILDDKIVFESIFRNYTRVPKNFGYVNNKYIYGLNNYDLSPDNFLDFLYSKHILVIKRLRGYEGLGFFLLKTDDSKKIFVNEKEFSEEELLSFVLSLDDSIISEYVNQSDFAHNLYPNSTNTIRIVCAKSKGEKEFKILKAVQRIGSDFSAPVDNISAGGLASSIDLDTGVLGYAVSKCGPMDIRLKDLEKHPDTNVVIKGKVIPNWNKIKDELLALTSKFPYLNLVAWDVLLTDDGFCIIEGNASSGCGLFQLHHGIKNEEYGDMLRSYGVFK